MRVFIFFLLFSICSCTSREKLTGKYWGGHTYTSIELNSDSTFSYRYKYEFAYEYASGIWNKLSSKRIVLNSYIRDRTIPLKVRESAIEREKNDNILTVNTNIPKEERSYYQCEIFINDTLYDKRSCDALSNLLIKKTINNIFFRIRADERIPNRFIDALYTEKIKPKLDNGKKLEVDFMYNDSLFNYRVFKDEVIRVTRNGLKLFDTRNKRWQIVPKSN